MKIKVVLENSAGELDSEIVENPKAVDADDMSEQIMEVIESWTLSVGDIVRIIEVTP